MIFLVDTDHDSLADAAEAARTVAGHYEAAAKEASRRLEAGELGDGDRRTPALRIASLLATAARLERFADAVLDARRDEGLDADGLDAAVDVALATATGPAASAEAPAPLLDPIELADAGAAAAEALAGAATTPRRRRSRATTEETPS